jgi:hypothetical protein
MEIVERGIISIIVVVLVVGIIKLIGWAKP